MRQEEILQLMQFICLKMVKSKIFSMGEDDLNNFTLKFIGNIEERIQQDFLRIFRYYRFLGTFEKPRTN